MAVREACTRGPCRFKEGIGVESCTGSSSKHKYYYSCKHKRRHDVDVRTSTQQMHFMIVNSSSGHVQCNKHALACFCLSSSGKFVVCVLGSFVRCADSIEVESRNGLHDILL